MGYSPVQKVETAEGTISVRGFRGQTVIQIPSTQKYKNLTAFSFVFLFDFSFFCLLV